MGYEIKSKKLYRDGREELVTEPEAAKLSVVACTPLESKILKLLSEGRRDELKNIGYKLAVACIKSGCIKYRDCRECFYSDICAYPKNPEWFRKKGLM